MGIGDKASLFNPEWPRTLPRPGSQWSHLPLPSKFWVKGVSPMPNSYWDFYWLRDEAQSKAEEKLSIEPLILLIQGDHMFFVYW